MLPAGWRMIPIRKGLRMKRMVLLMVAVGLLGTWLLPSAALAQGADTYGVGAGKGDLLGGGLVFFTFDLSAHDGGPQGDFGYVGGTLRDTAGNKLSYRMVADCVAIPTPLGPGTAAISGVVKKASGGPVGGPAMFDFAPGDRLFVSVTDGGNPKDRPVDGFVVGEFSPFPCDLFNLRPFTNVTQGNIVIKQ
jgi:hypothetical protein